MSIVMGIDQHRAQITAEWIELETGEIGRARVRPADRGGVRRFLARFSGRPLEVATEATTGWRFLVEELRAAGAEVHLAEPAETAALRGNKKHAKSDRADARHLRELLLAGRVPESWIPPDHILDLRARVRLRHMLIKAHCEHQQRIQAVLYHHGCAQRRGLMVGDGREWLAGQPLPETAREQITVALAMIDALDVQIAPIDRELRAYARAQTGCKALIDAYYGIGELCAVTIVSELGDCRRFSNSRDAVRYGGMDITVYQSDRHRAPGHLSRQGPPALRWALYEAAQVARHQLAGSRLLRAGGRAPGRQPRLPGARAQAAQALLSHAARARRRRARATARRGLAHAAQPRVTATLRASNSGNGQCAGRLSRPSPALMATSPTLKLLDQLRPSCARQVLTHTDAPRPAPELLLRTRYPRGPPRKIERPQRFPHRDHPIKHPVTGPPEIRVADRSKPGRPRAPPHPVQPRTA